MRYVFGMDDIYQAIVSVNCSVFSTDHAMTCSHGGLTITRHNDIYDITASWFSEVCRREPPLLPLTG